MKKIWLVFKYEYTRHVLRKRFLIALFSAPLFMAFIMGASIIASLSAMNDSPAGFIDQSGVFADYEPDPVSKGFLEMDIPFIRYTSEEDARIDLKAKTIQAYFVISEDFLQSANVKMVYEVSPGENIQGRFSNQLRRFLLSTQPQDVIDRINEGSHITIQSADGSRTAGENDWISIVLQFGAGILFIIVLFTSSGYLMQALVEEKENRTMEIMVTSVSPEQLMAGKVLGNLSVGLTQLAFWVACIVVIFLLGQGSVSWMQNARIEPSVLLVFAATMIPAFIMVAALMALLGAAFSEAREAQQWTSLISLPVVCPYWLATPILANPNSPLAVGLSLFPLTAPVTISMRMAVAIVPTWQVITSSALLIICAVGAIWLSARVFQLGMVRYGKKVSLKEVFVKTEKQHA